MSRLHLKYLILLPSLTLFSTAFIVSVIVGFIPADQYLLLSVVIALPFGTCLASMLHGIAFLRSHANKTLEERREDHHYTE